MIDLQVLVGWLRMMVMSGILGINNIRNLPELIPVVGSFNKHRIANLPLSVADVTLQPLPHD